MAGGSDDMSCMFLGGGKGDMIDLWCRGLDYDDSQMAAKIQPCPQFRVFHFGFCLDPGQADGRDFLRFSLIGWLIFGG